jgi:hypothetical protein
VRDAIQAVLLISFSRRETPVSEPQEHITHSRANPATATPVGSVSQHAAATAHPLRLDYMQLKKRLGGVPDARRKKTKPAFVELITPHPATLEECVIEFESAGGSKIRIQWKAATPPDWANLLRACS